MKIRELDSASNALALIVSTGGDPTRINSVNYSIDDNFQLVKDACARAFSGAKDRAQQYARLSGLNLGKVISISESAGPPPTPLPRAMATPCRRSQASRPLAAGTVVWELGYLRPR